MIDSILTFFFGSKKDRDIKQLLPIVEKVNAEESWAASLSETEVKETTMIVEGAKYVDEVKVFTNNDQKYISVIFTEEGQEKYKELCQKTQTIYLVLGDYNQSISVAGATDYSALTLSNTDWNNMIALEQKIQLGCAKVELDGVNARIDTMSTTMSAGESASSPEYENFFTSNIYVVSMASLIVIAVLILSFLALNFGFFAVIGLISMLINTYLFLFIAWLVPSFELGISVVFALSVGLAVIYSYVYDFARNVRSEYNLGKSLAASLESSYKKTVLNTVICGLVLFASSLVLMALSFGEITSVAIAFAIISALMLFTNLCVIPFLVKIFISFGKFDRKVFKLKKKISLSEYSKNLEAKSKEDK
jgi:hypothetical protein